MNRSLLLIAGCVAPPLGILSAQHSLAAEASPVTVTRFEYRAPEGCGSRDEFVAQVRRRTARISLQAEASDGRSLFVEIESRDAAGSLQGSVTVVEPDGSARTRKLKAKNCDEAVEGLALIATVTLDPEALAAELPSPEPTITPSPPSPSSGPTVPPPAVQSVTAEPTPSRYRVSVGLQGAALFAAAPEAAPGVAVSVALEMNPGELLSPFVRFSIMHAQRRSIPLGNGEANFAFTLPTLDLCPIRIGPSRFAIRPCAYVSVGAARTWGSETAKSEDFTRLSGSVGGAISVQVGIGETFEIVVDGRAGAALLRDEYAFDRVGLWRTRALLFSTAAGVTVGFP